MKQESRLSSQQRKQKETKHEAASLPPTYQSVQKAQPCASRRRSAECCQRGGSYQRDQFRPAPTRDLEKEKRRLQSILATGKEESSEDSSSGKATKKKSREAEELDQYEEALNEIEERRQFLADMASLGQEGPYIDIINTEISQKLRELELLDKDGRSKQRKDTAAETDEQVLMLDA
uniref:Uncharacterized protein n=2 Tax=Gouania willdenowi TaxID=441366 RepID=A0A8C5DM48_GOUWI